MRHVDWLFPDWPAEGVGALMTTRAGGVSAAPFDRMNLRFGIGDDDAAVARNRAILAEAIGRPPLFLDQVHGSHVLRLAASSDERTLPQADASITTERGVACAVQVADCLPVLFAAPAGRGVGAAHAGWRGLAGGVLEATVTALCDAAACAPHELCAWLGPCIGPAAFEVGADVVAAFGDDAANCFVPRAQPGKWLADLPALARQRLRAAGVEAISGGSWCTATDASRFFSFRRDRVTGRMVAAVWLA